MALSKQEAVAQARADMARRVGSPADKISEDLVEDADFPDMALGAGVGGEMSGQMITPGWRIVLSANGERLEYRANRGQVRLFNYKGRNFKL
jgi:hypothetical protein